MHPLTVSSCFHEPSVFERVAVVIVPILVLCILGAVASRLVRRRSIVLGATAAALAGGPIPIIVAVLDGGGYAGGELAWVSVFFSFAGFVCGLTGALLGRYMSRRNSPKSV